ncbi:MurR/RpiR family transcriptional regulator [Phyllobacterium meliloti]|uniref:MurR/RpiR family transcriptional regulator n=1 Tax=Phyllobacterium meliloti TaxID=555317 RepID=UPI001D14D1AF|nr:MurR/RpiR family transcriptional regulator [Phyllobacterium sp. T1293]UGX89172.1 MurR/RpiR family transcriptional regulator [Phyllobacterium sp. T1293]
MTESVRARLSESLLTATNAEKAIANYMLANLNGLPFETSATLAAKVGVSEPTVGRFCRSLGYARFKDLKSDLRDNIGDRPWLVGDRLKEFRDRNLEGDMLARSLDLEIAALVRIYEIAHTKEWKRTIKRLATIPRVFVAGFQTERGMAQYFANQLQYLRPNVSLADVAGGNFHEILMEPPKSSCLVLFEARRYSQLAISLAREARSAKIPITLVTDAFCDWGHDLVDEMFVVPTEFDMFWESTAQMASLGNLLLNGVFNELGVSVEKRMNKVSELHGKFTGYVGE